MNFQETYKYKSNQEFNRNFTTFYYKFKVFKNLKIFNKISMEKNKFV